jgi:hypothetical protein
VKSGASLLAADPPTLPAPRPWVESIGQLRLPASADDRLETLMDRNNEGELSGAERDELAALAEVSELLSLLRAEALSTLRQ